MKSLFPLLVGLLVGFMAAMIVAGKHEKNLPPPPATPKVETPVVQAPAPTPQPQAYIKETIVASQPTPESGDILEKLSMLDLQRACSKADRLVENALENYAKKISDQAERSAAVKELFEQLETSLESSSWWRGNTEILNGNKSLRFEVFFRFYSRRDTDKGDPLKSDTLAKAAVPEDLCYITTIFTTYDGRTSRTGSGGCTTPQRKKDNDFYMAQYFPSQDKISEVTPVVLLPYPVSSPVPVEYLPAGSTQWAKRGDMGWRPSNAQELNEMRDHYDKIMLSPGAPRH